MSFITKLKVQTTVGTTFTQTYATLLTGYFENQTL